MERPLQLPATICNQRPHDAPSICPQDQQLLAKAFALLASAHKINACLQRLVWDPWTRLMPTLAPPWLEPTPPFVEGLSCGTCPALAVRHAWVCCPNQGCMQCCLCRSDLGCMWCCLSCFNLGCVWCWMWA